MNKLDIANLRFRNQGIVDASFTNPADVVSWFGAVQAQDFAAAKWALGLRMSRATDAGIEEAFNRGEILRTHIMRPTWHFVAPQDIRWLLALTSPRVQAFNGSYYRKSGLDKTIFERSNKIIVKALQGGKQLTRSELDIVLRQAGIPTEKMGLSYTVMQAELDGIICSGPRRGKQFTYVLLEERIPRYKILERDEALSELIKRYFTSHCPAQIQDFVWWSGLTASDAKRGLEMNKDRLEKAVVEGQTYWFHPSRDTAKARASAAYLLPFYDEYVVSYKDRSSIFDAKYARLVNNRGGILHPTIVIDGQVIGTWKRTIGKDTVTILLQPFVRLTVRQKEGIAGAAKQYGEFLGMSVTIA